MLVPWSLAKEEAHGEACERVTFEDVDRVLHVQLKTGWDTFNVEGAARVGCLSLPSSQLLLQ